VLFRLKSSRTDNGLQYVVHRVWETGTEPA
jgi:hypothetical protein